MPASLHAGCGHSGHSVLFYRDDNYLLQSTAESIGPALEAGDAAIVIATREHREGLAERLRARGLDVEKLSKSGQYFARDAGDTLGAFMNAGDWPDEKRFADIVGGLIAQATVGVERKRKVVAFGEMVALLWLQGNHKAALHLEQLWNALSKDHEFTLRCAYPLNGFSRQENRHLFLDICAEHLHVISSETYSALASETQLEELQKVRSIEARVRLSDQRMLTLQDVSGIGTWELDCAEEKFQLSQKAQRILGVAGTRELPISELLQMMFYSGDRDAFIAAMTRAQTRDKEFAAEFRINRGGEARLLSTRGKMFFNSDSPLILGMLMDVSAVA